MTDLNYDPRKSKVSADTTEAWNSSTITGDLIEVPGLGPKALDLLKHDAQGIESEQITNTYMLFGKYLLLKGPNLAADGKTWREVDSIEHNEKFWFWIKDKGIVAHRSAIVKAIAEKSSTFFANFYDANAYDDDDSDME